MTTHSPGLEVEYGNPFKWASKIPLSFLSPPPKVGLIQRSINFMAMKTRTGGVFYLHQLNQMRDYVSGLSTKAEIEHALYKRPSIDTMYYCLRTSFLRFSAPHESTMIIRSLGSKVSSSAD
ncbi:hypothetical protein Vadar_003229 [Vaccinium darrowii]|uniref:Uncharacterized protein n=1 Tax=Vaccinium darrowii TaxID=229202 RepID=A0ACB7WX65_9ERIC|nr:hypothetical protein Vadar_003229 [Vaccinium darrowii]